MAQPTQPLPAKETALFRQVVKFYETKQYKKAIKAADQILKKVPEHGETLAMKGLTLNYMDRKEEAYDLVRRGLKADLKSHVCWHVYGLLHRSDNNYMEAIKCYLNALRIDKDNAQILRDLAMLQIQMRDITGFVDTRHRLLQLRSNNRNNWVTFAVAHHLDGNHDMAVNILTAYESTLEGEVSGSEAYEHSELLSYKAQVLAEGGQLEAALALLDKEQDKLKDKLGVMHIKAELLLALQRPSEAEALYRQLLALNPDDYRVHEGLQRCLGIPPPSEGHSWQHAQAAAAAAAQQQQQQQQQASPSSSDAPSSSSVQWSPHSGKKRRLLQAYSPAEHDKLVGLYEQLCEAYPRSLACHRIPLDFLSGEDFRAAADAYVRRFLLRGIPSLFSDLRPLYDDASKADALQQLFQGYAVALRSSGALPPLLRPPPGGDASSSSGGSGAANGPAASGDSSSHSSSSSNGPASAAANGSSAGAAAADADAGGEDNPLTWVLHYLAQHYDRRGDTAKALEASDASLGLAPRAIELLLARSKILKHAGDLAGAAAAADAARCNDLADRYANSMAVRALFAAGLIDAAEQTALLFTRDSDQLNNLYDMQHMWYEVRCGEAYLGAGQLPRALKKFSSVAKHFSDFAEDQFDFHSYCVRKMTLRPYLALLRLEDRLHHHPFYLRAAVGAIRCYLALHDAPAAAAAAEQAAEAELAALSPEARKKERLRRKKEEKRREREAEAAAAAAAAAAAEAAKAAAAASGGSEGGGKQQKKKASHRPPDPDPDGVKLAATSDPLGEATKFVCMLKQAAPQHLETQLAAAEVYGRKGRPLLEAAAVKRAVELAGRQHPDVHRALVRLAQRVAASPPANPAVAQLVGELLAELLGGSPSAAAYAQAYFKQHAAPGGGSSSLRQLAAAAEMAALLDPGAKAAGVAALLAAAPAAVAAAAVAAGPEKAAEHAACVDAHKLLLSGPLADAAAAEQWRQRCAALFERSGYFGGAAATSLEQLRAQLKQGCGAGA